MNSAKRAVARRQCAVAGHTAVPHTVSGSIPPETAAHSIASHPDETTSMRLHLCLPGLRCFRLERRMEGVQLETRAPGSLAHARTALAGGRLLQLCLCRNPEPLRPEQIQITEPIKSSNLRHSASKLAERRTAAMPVQIKCGPVHGTKLFQGPRPAAAHALCALGVGGCTGRIVRPQARLGWDLAWPRQSLGPRAAAAAQLLDVTCSLGAHTSATLQTLPAHVALLMPSLVSPGAGDRTSQGLCELLVQHLMSACTANSARHRQGRRQQALQDERAGSPQTCSWQMVRFCYPGAGAQSRPDWAGGTSKDCCTFRLGSGS